MARDLARRAVGREGKARRGICWQGKGMGWREGVERDRETAGMGTGTRAGKGTRSWREGGVWGWERIQTAGGRDRKGRAGERCGGKGWEGKGWDGKEWIQSGKGNGKLERGGGLGTGTESWGKGGVGQDRDVAGREGKGWEGKELSGSGKGREWEQQRERAVGRWKPEGVVEREWVWRAGNGNEKGWAVVGREGKGREEEGAGTELAWESVGWEGKGRDVAGRGGEGKRMDIRVNMDNRNEK